MDLNPKKLVDLAPEWIADNDGRIHGIRFHCPIHTTVPGNPDFECTHSVGFTNPPAGGPPQAYWSTTWARSGETFEMLRLTPSIRCLGFQNAAGGEDGGCRWHGYVGGSGGEVPGMVTTLADSR